MQKFSIVVLFVLVSLVTLVRADSASPADFPADAPALAVGQLATIEGVVRFEEHRTIIPLFVCPGHEGPCIGPRPYWSLIVSNDQGQFEIDQRFALDQSVPPETIELAGQKLEAGQVVRVEATVEYASQGYYVLGNVREVNPVSESQTLSLPNWTCRGTVDRDTEVEAEVWSMGATGGSESPLYALRLNGAQGAETQGRRFFPLAALSDAQGFPSRDQLVYQGADVSADVELTINATGDPGAPSAPSAPARRIPGHLRFTLSELPAQHSGFQAQGDYPVVCQSSR